MQHYSTYIRYRAHMCIKVEIVKEGKQPFKSSTLAAAHSCKTMDTRRDVE